MSANRDKRRQYNEISSIIRQSSIKAVRSRGNNKIGNHPYKFSTGQAQEKPQQAEVIAVGPGGMVDGKEVKMQVTVGQKVIYSKYAGTEVKLDGEEYIIVRQNDILAVVE